MLCHFLGKNVVKEETFKTTIFKCSKCHKVLKVVKKFKSKFFNSCF